MYSVRIIADYIIKNRQKKVGETVHRKFARIFAKLRCSMIATNINYPAETTTETKTQRGKITEKSELQKRSETVVAVCSTNLLVHAIIAANRCRLITGLMTTTRILHVLESQPTSYALVMNIASNCSALFLFRRIFWFQFISFFWSFFLLGLLSLLSRSVVYGSCSLSLALFANNKIKKPP